MSPKTLDGEPWAVSLALWGYELRGDILETTAFIAEGGDDRNGKPLWDHPEWLEGWYRNTGPNAEPYIPPLHRALPYAPGSPWAESAP
jgi:hypothetical protein